MRNPLHYRDGRYYADGSRTYNTEEPYVCPTRAMEELCEVPLELAAFPPLPSPRTSLLEKIAAKRVFCVDSYTRFPVHGDPITIKFSFGVGIAEALVMVQMLTTTVEEPGLQKFEPQLYIHEKNPAFPGKRWDLGGVYRPYPHEKIMYNANQNQRHVRAGSFDLEIFEEGWMRFYLRTAGAECFPLFINTLARIHPQTQFRVEDHQGKEFLTHAEMEAIFDSVYWAKREPQWIARRETYNPSNILGYDLNPRWVPAEPSEEKT